MFKLHFILAEAIWTVKHDLTEVIESFQIVVTAVVGAMAVAPLVVAGNIDHGFFEPVEAACSIGVLPVVARRTAIFNVTVKHAEFDIGGVDVVD